MINIIMSLTGKIAILAIGFIVAWNCGGPYPQELLIICILFLALSVQIGIRGR